MKTAVVILNWNGKELLERFLPSVLEHTNDAHIYVADNASTDSSVAFVEQQFPSVSIIQNKSNLGYAGGYNAALKNLQEELFILLNSDVEVTENWLTPIQQAFKSDPALAAAQPKILDAKRPNYFEYAGAAGGFLDQLGYPYCRGRIFNTIEEDVGQYDDTIPIFWASGACLAVRRNAFFGAGGFDEDLFAHYEEIDLCWRLQQSGGSIRYLGNSKVYHVGGATLEKQRPEKTFYNFRNSLLVLLKNHPSNKVFLFIFLRMLLDALAAFQFILQGKPTHSLAIIRAHLSFYTKVGRFFKKRDSTLSPISYYHCKSVIWRYFVLKKRTFNNGY